ncbi:MULTISPECIES: hypothetical protein [Clostridia]|uniref:hypothetical protein n=1 Tax=Clostridia TaxID=186801 RepID=UPI0024E24DAC|nr:hypothetical protein [Eubacterium sp. AF22-9]
MDNSVMIKGSSNGITVVLDNDMPFEELLDNISEKIQKTHLKFFNNANMAISFNGMTCHLKNY